MKKGREIEAQYSKEVYSSESYFELTQLQSFVYQLKGVRTFEPKSILEIGVGSGFTSTFLKRAGYQVTTLDINQNLEPDICSDLKDLPLLNLNGKYDLVVCCQVLEHMEFDEFERNISTLSSIGDLYLTLPNYFSYFGVGGILRLPYLRKDFSLYIKSPFKVKNLKEGIHYWEIDSENKTSLKNIRSILKKYFKDVEAKKIPTNPYHMQFLCRH